MSRSSQNSFIKISFSNKGRSIYAPSVKFRGDIILFTVFSESFPHVSKSDVSVIDGRVNGLPVSDGKSFFDIIDLPEKDVDLFLSILYGTGKTSALFPFDGKTLLVFTGILRAGGAGLAFVIDIPPSAAAALAHSDLYLQSDDIIFSPSFESYTPSEIGAMELYSLISHLLSGASKNSTPLPNLIRTISELSMLEVSVQLSLEVGGEPKFDQSTVFSMLLCILFHAARVGCDKAIITVSGERDLSITTEFETKDEHLSNGILFCEKTAENMGAAFMLDCTDGHFKATFVPTRNDPSLIGLKSGIFINGKRFRNPFLSDQP